MKTIQYAITGACRDSHHKRCKAATQASGAKGCECVCHDPAPRRNLLAHTEAVREAARKATPVNERKRSRDLCRHGHDLSATSGNLGPNGACRVCKRIANDRCRERGEFKKANA